MSQKRFMIAAPSSGSGKTLVTCGLMHGLIQKGISVQSYKCGPDFIDPMFHRHITGRPAGNLDAFLSSSETVRNLLARDSETADITVIEGVMGCHDGTAFGRSDGSSCDIAAKTGTPAILVLNARGMSSTILSVIRGLCAWENGQMIRGIILNRISAGIYPALKKMIEEALPVSVIGYLPELPDIRLDSRHLGLMMPHEVRDLDGQLDRLAECMEETINLDLLLALSEEAEQLPSAAPYSFAPIPDKVRIAVAEDEAFCFLYAENLRMLKEAGAELIPFSPLKDRAVPEQADALLLCGGYPELFCEELSRNESMRQSVRRACESGMPVLAECGGFLYLHRELEDPDGVSWPMCGVIDARAWNNHRLTRFGYITMQNGTMFGQETGEIRAHEFHHYESSDPGDAFLAVKPDGKRKWYCAHTTDTLYAGFPHLYYPANPSIVTAFLNAASSWRKRTTER